MSNVVKKVKRVFKKVGRALKKVVKPLLIIAAVYFTAGLALSAFPATAGFAASMPGFAGGGFLGIGVGSGATAGTGLLTKAAVKLGVGTLGKAGGLVGGALAKGTTVAKLTTAVGAKAVSAGGAKALSAGLIKTGGVATAGLEGGGAVSLATKGGAALGDLAAPATKVAGGAIESGQIAATVGSKISLSDKLLLAAAGTQAIGGLLEPSPREIAEAQKRWVGAFYGDEGGGAGAQPRNPLIPPPPGGAPGAFEGVQATRAQSPQATRQPSAAMQPSASVGGPGRRAVPAETARARQLIPSQQPYRYGADSLVAEEDVLA